MAEAQLTIRVNMEPLGAAVAALAATIGRMLDAYAPLWAEVHRQDEWTTAVLPRGRHGSRVQRARRRQAVTRG